MPLVQFAGDGWGEDFAPVFGDAEVEEDFSAGGGFDEVGVGGEGREVVEFGDGGSQEDGALDFAHADAGVDDADFGGGPRCCGGREGRG